MVNTEGVKAMVIYSMDTNAVEPVVYPVVPDSFMSRESADHRGQTHLAIDSHPSDVIDSPFLAPQDPWSF
jgi:hypothetical protein